MSTFPTTGDYPFQITSQSAKPKVGGLSLTYTVNNDGTISSASAVYNPANGNNSQTIPLTFSGTAAPYTAVPTTQPIPNGWNVPNQGVFFYASFTFSPPAGTFTGTLTGSASKDPLPGTVDNITWEADPSTTTPEEEYPQVSGASGA